MQIFFFCYVKYSTFNPYNDFQSKYHLFQTLLEFICNQSRGGKIVHSYEARQFAKLSQNMVKNLKTCPDMNKNIFCNILATFKT